MKNINSLQTDLDADLKRGRFDPTLTVQRTMGSMRPILDEVLDADDDTWLHRLRGRRTVGGFDGFTIAAASGDGRLPRLVVHFYPENEMDHDSTVLTPHTHYYDFDAGTVTGWVDHTFYEESDQPDEGELFYRGDVFRINKHQVLQPGQNRVRLAVSDRRLVEPGGIITLHASTVHSVIADPNTLTVTVDAGREFVDRGYIYYPDPIRKEMLERDTDTFPQSLASIRGRLESLRDRL